MARPGLTKHRKFGRLARLLRSAITARGVLELLWDTCYESGEAFVGRSDDVAYAVGWTETAPDQLVSALVEAGFLDETPDGYVVHDLFDHAPDYVLKRRRREQERRTRGAAQRESASSDRRTADNDRRTAPNGRTPSPSPSPSPKSVTRAREASAPADAAAHTHSAPRPVDLTGPPKVIAAWCDGYEAATQQPAMLRPGKADQDARLVADWLTRADAWPSLDALVRLFLAAPEFAGKRQLGMFAANLPQLAAWLTEHGPDVPYGDEDARFRAERARELAKLTAQAAQDAPRTTIGRAEASQVVRRLETVLRPAGGIP